MRSLLLFSLCLGACTLDVERTEDAEDAEVSDADRDIVIDGPDSEPEPDAALPDLGIASE
ncbi:MAG: hypothetical protein GY913_28705, partial [Proteobacteria bacterium]|nr:hypothetical protein [Pseudomonadota bacterium]